jgi:hypothetical protein
MPAKGDVNLQGKQLPWTKADGTPSVYSEKINTEFQASRHRLTENGPPSREALEQARASLPDHQQAWLQDASRRARPEWEIARMATSKNLEPERREAYRTLLDGAHASNRNDFMIVANRNPEKGEG